MSEEQGSRTDKSDPALDQTLTTHRPMSQQETGEFSTDAPPQSAEPTSDIPDQIGRYRIKRILG